MPSRHFDWLKQARRDLDHARHALNVGDHEWACFAAQQGAEKAVKALFQSLGAEAWGHSVSVLLAGLPDEMGVGEELLQKAKELDKHYIPPRYPNSHPQGAPFEYYTRPEAERAIANGEAVISFCEDKMR